MRKHGAGKGFREMVSGAKTNRLQPDRVIDQLDASDVLRVIRLDQLARRTRDLFNTLAAIADRKAGFRSLSDAWADTITVKPPATSPARAVAGPLGDRLRVHAGRCWYTRRRMDAAAASGFSCSGLAQHASP